MLDVGNSYKRVAECEHCALHVLKLTEEGSRTSIWMSFTFGNGQNIFIIHLTHTNSTPFANHNLQCRMGSITWCGHAATLPENEFASSLISRLFSKNSKTIVVVLIECVLLNDSMYLIIVINGYCIIVLKMREWYLWLSFTQKNDKDMKY